MWTSAVFGKAVPPFSHPLEECLSVDPVRQALKAGDHVNRATAVENFSRAPSKVPESGYPPVPESMHPVSHRLGGWYRQTELDQFSSTCLKVVGGTTWHWLGTIR